MTASSRSWPSSIRTPPSKSPLPMNPMVDGWMGDDWFHNGAFREQTCPTSTSRKHAQERREMVVRCLRRLRPLSARRLRGELGRQAGMEQLASGKKFSSIPATTPGGRASDWTKSSPPNRSRFPQCWWTASGTRKDIYGAPLSTKLSSPKTRLTTKFSRPRPLAPRPGN